ncbi:MAG: methyl-viologen-reducing hydrogenase subunit delta [Candidatus Aminicenantes bacterium RBG_16_66_30]|nr:MAG: methyl-viologen-reducing hydrogenase subunit delta [Candidatus Aminicenantes bacterium RBG_16_66_30]
MFEPQIMCFLCKWCTSSAADAAGTSRLRHAPNTINMRVMCSSRVDPQHIIYAFKEGADGVFLGGCHPGDCHYVEGNYKTLRRITLFKIMLRDLGIDPKRLRLEWISAAEGKKYAETMNEFTEQIRALGPLHLNEKALVQEVIKDE